MPSVTDRAATPSSWGEDLGLALLGGWLVAGAHLDGWAHRYLRNLETFFTPWHGVLYSGFVAAAGWLVAVVVRRRRRGRPIRTWPPAGYGLGLLAAAVFVVGGLGDLLWHEAFGIEVGIEAELSPTHLVLLAAAVVMLTTPLRSTLRRHGGMPGGFRQTLPAILAVSSAVAIVVLFLTTLSELATTSESPGAGSLNIIDSFTAIDFARYLITTIVLVVPVLTVYRWGRCIPAGLITATVAAVTLSAGVLSEFAEPIPLLAVVAGGLAADVVVTVVSGRAPRLAALTAGAAVPALVWSAQLGARGATTGLSWRIHVWLGLVVLTAAVGAVLAGMLRPWSPSQEDHPRESGTVPTMGDDEAPVSPRGGATR